ncbi:MAG: hypothetical protein F4X66_07165, partial [Chloroflexi bacterium]|nr:hypothetical protein [Chloroflexota bacterium]
MTVMVTTVSLVCDSAAVAFTCTRERLPPDSRNSVRTTRSPLFSVARSTRDCSGAPGGAVAVGGGGGPAGGGRGGGPAPRPGAAGGVRGGGTT